MSQRQLRCFMMLYLSLLRAVILPVIRPTYSPQKVMMRRSQMGAVIRIHHGLPSSLRMRSLNVEERYTSPSLRK